MWAYFVFACCSAFVGPRAARRDSPHDANATQLTQETDREREPNRRHSKAQHHAADDTTTHVTPADSGVATLSPPPPVATRLRPIGAALHATSADTQNEQQQPTYLAIDSGTSHSDGARIDGPARRRGCVVPPRAAPINAAAARSAHHTPHETHETHRTAKIAARTHSMHDDLPSALPLVRSRCEHVVAEPAMLLERSPRIRSFHGGAHVSCPLRHHTTRQTTDIPRGHFAPVSGRRRLSAGALLCGLHLTPTLRRPLPR